MTARCTPGHVLFAHVKTALNTRYVWNDTEAKIFFDIINGSIRMLLFFSFFDEKLQMDATNDVEVLHTLSIRASL